MNTHILYRAVGKRYKQYFAGVYEGRLDKDGFAMIDFKWSTNRNDATEMQTTDAWDLLGMCRYQWPNLTLEVERVVQWNINGSLVAR